MTPDTHRHPDSPASPARRPRVVFINSLYRSGSTFLEFLLASLPDVVGVGEMMGPFDRFAGNKFKLNRYTHEGDIDSTMCQCGQPAPSCELWSAVLRRINGKPLDRVAFYGHTIEAVADVYGPDTVIIDSSKRIEFLVSLLALDPPVDVKVINLVRDVRAWAVSKRAIDRQEREANTALFTLNRSYPVLMMKWYRRNRAAARAIAALDVETYHLGYERYATDPGRYITELAEFIGADPTGAGEIVSPKTHMIGGNPMKDDPTRRSKITYDTRWMSRSDRIAASILLRPIMRYNTRAVYGAAGSEVIGAK